MPENHAKRRAALVAKLAESDVHAALITNLVNVRYLSGFTGSNAALLVTPEESVLATDFRYLTQSGAEAPGAHANNTTEITKRNDAERQLNR